MVGLFDHKASDFCSWSANVCNVVSTYSHIVLIIIIIDAGHDRIFSSQEEYEQFLEHSRSVL